MVSDPPPDGRRNPCAQPPTGATSGVSGCPLSAADQPPVGSASTNVPPAAGTLAPATRTVPEFTGTTVPFCSTTRTRAVVSDTRHSANAAV